MNNSICPLARRLKQARTSRNISQKQLGVLAGMDENVASARMNQYERGKHQPDYDTLKAIARILAVPLTYFYCCDDRDAEMLRSFNRLTESQKDQLRALIKRVDFSLDEPELNNT